MKIEEKLAKQIINRLNISDNVIRILKANNINTLKDLCEKSKTYFKKIDLNQNDINAINIELQLLGLRLKEKI